MNDPALPPALVALLDAERARPELPTETVSAALARWQATRGGGAPGADGAPGSSEPSGSAEGTGGAGDAARWGSRVGSALAGLLLGGAVGYGVAQMSDPAPARMAEEAPPPAAHVASEAAVAPSGETTTPSVVGSAPVVAPKLRASSFPAAPPSTLRAERVLIERARSALLRGDARAAREAIALHRERFPDGQLAEERELLRSQVDAAGDDGG
jgi:hypothetical protein